MVALFGPVRAVVEELEWLCDLAAAWLTIHVPRFATLGGRLSFDATAATPLPIPQWAQWVQPMLAFGGRLQSVLARYPRLTRLALMGGIVFVCVLRSSHVAQAGPGGDVLNQITGDLQTFGGNNGTNWMDNSLAVGKSLFSFLALFVLVSTAFRYYLNRGTMRGGAPLLLQNLIMIFVPFAVLLGAQPVLDGLFEAATYLTGAISQQAVPAITTPGSVLDEGFSTAIQFPLAYAHSVFGHLAAPLGHCHLTDLGCFGGALATKFTQLILSLSMFGLVLMLALVAVFAFAFVALELVMAYAYAFLTLPLGAWTLGFSALEATSDVAMAYWSSVMRALMRFIVIFAVVAFVQHTYNNYAHGFDSVLNYQWAWNNLQSIGAGIWLYLKTMIGISVSSVVLAYLVLRAAATADSIGSGRASISFIGGVATAAAIGRTAF